jgi:hypothetical protein
VKLDASNLGQIIGRLIYPDVEPLPPAAPAIARTLEVIARGERQRELVALLAMASSAHPVTSPRR